MVTYTYRVAFRPVREGGPHYFEVVSGCQSAADAEVAAEAIVKRKVSDFRRRDFLMEGKLLSREFNLRGDEVGLRHADRNPADSF